MTRHMPAQRPGRSKQDYSTPDEFIAAVLTELDIPQFEHDFAADLLNAKALSYWDKQIDSLSMRPSEWAFVLDGRWGWLNPPFSHLGLWVRAAWRASLHGAHIAMLVPASVGANWFKSYVHKKANVKFLNGRLHFMGADQPGYPKDCMLLLYSPEPAFLIGYDVWSWRQPTT